jgi:hypothetical protein
MIVQSLGWLRFYVEDHKKTRADEGSVKSRAVVLEGLPEEDTTSGVGARGRQQQERSL